MPDAGARKKGFAARAVGDPLPPTYPTVVHMLLEAAAKSPDREAVVCGDRRLSYAELRGCVGALANRLVDLGAAGSRIVVLLPNSIELVVAAHAVHAARAQLSMLNPAYTERELGPILEDADPLLAITDRAGYERCHRLFAERTRLAPIVLGGEDWDIAASGTGCAIPAELPCPDDLAVLQYTGGTTGRAKGVVVGHGAWALNVAQRAVLLPHRMDAERFLVMTPLFHAYAIASALYPAIHSRGTLVILPRYKPEWVFETIARERITYFPGLPTIYTGLLSHPGFTEADFTSVRTCVSGAAPLPIEVLKRWEELVGVPICEGYGLTEASAVLTYNPLYGLQKPGSVGLPLPGTEIQIVDVESGEKVLERNQLGEVRARGPQLMLGYRNLPEETGRTIRDGWLYTGDIGELDDDGYLFLRDRKKQMAIVGGYNVFPREIEEVLYRHPAVAEAAAVGVPDSYYGEVIGCLVRLHPTASADEAELLAHCRRHLVKYKVPAGIRLGPEIPKTGAGKTDHKRIKAEWNA